VPHAAGSGGLPPLSFLGPVVLPYPSGRESTAGAGLLLNVEGTLYIYIIDNDKDGVLATFGYGNYSQ